MTNGQSSRGSLQKKPPLQGTNGSRARPLDFDVDLELDIDWEAIGFGPSNPRPAPPPASQTKPLATCNNGPVSRIAEKKPAQEPELPRQNRSEEDEAPTSVFARAEGSRSTLPPPEPAVRQRAVTAPLPMPESAPPPASSTLIMDYADVVGAPPASHTSGQTLVMTREQLLRQTPQPAPTHEAPVVATKVMSMNEVVGRQSSLERELPSDFAATPDPESGPHTKMMPIDVLMKRANAQQRWPLPGVEMRAELRDSDRAGSSKRSFFGRVGEGWRKTSLVRKASLLLMPLLCALILVRYTKLGGAPKRTRGKTPAAATSAARPAPLPPQRGGPAPATSAAAPVNEPSAPIAQNALPRPAEATSGTPPGSAVAAPASAAPPVAGSPPRVRSSGGAVTAQRKAADAVAEGDYAVAVERYRVLAHEDPGVPAYREAARILEERASGARR